MSEIISFCVISGSSLLYNGSLKKKDKAGAVDFANKKGIQESLFFYVIWKYVVTFSQTQ